MVALANQTLLVLSSEIANQADCEISVGYGSIYLRDPIGFYDRAVGFWQRDTPISPCVQAGQTRTAQIIFEIPTSAAANNLTLPFALQDVPGELFVSLPSHFGEVRALMASDGPGELFPERSTISHYYFTGDARLSFEYEKKHAIGSSTPLLASDFLSVKVSIENHSEEKAITIDPALFRVVNAYYYRYAPISLTLDPPLQSARLQPRETLLG